MAVARPFYCVRPTKENVEKVVCLPYDVYSRKEAKHIVQSNKESFLAIERPDTQFSRQVGMYEEEVYAKAKELLKNRLQSGSYVRESDKAFYVYEMIRENRSQTGIVACVSIDDYCNGIIKRHENTREDKVNDRLNHIRACKANTGVVFLTYSYEETIYHIMEEAKNKEPLYNFTTKDQVGHKVWRIGESDRVMELERSFEQVSYFYIADGHHRAASAVQYGLEKRKEQGDYDGSEEYNYFLSVLFPKNELTILPYNRYVCDLNGYDTHQFLALLGRSFSIFYEGKSPVEPKKKGQIGMYVKGTWYLLTYKNYGKEEKDCISSLDVMRLQTLVLEPILKILDLRNDPRIQFIGGIRGNKELEQHVDENGGVAFSMYATSIDELIEVSNQNQLMPPKSTWFEPKIPSGLFLHILS